MSSTRRGTGSMVRSSRGRERVQCVERTLLDAQQSLRGVARYCRSVEGRRIVPPVSCRFMWQPWRERPPSCTRFLTPAAPQGVVHATAARCQRPQMRHAISPRFKRVCARVLVACSVPKPTLNPPAIRSASFRPKQFGMLVVSRVESGPAQEAVSHSVSLRFRFQVSGCRCM